MLKTLRHQSQLIDRLMYPGKGVIHGKHILWLPGAHGKFINHALTDAYNRSERSERLSLPFFIILRLCAPHLIIFSLFLGQQFLMRSSLYQLSFMKHQDFIAETAGGQSM